MTTPDTTAGTSLTWLPPRYAEAHVWRAVLDRPAPVCRELELTLSPDERARTARFHFERDRRRFVVGRGVLRHILASYLALSPGEIQFAYTPHGKPILAGSMGCPALHFNVSHSRHLALLAFGHQELGVDLEYVRPVPDAAQIAARLFSAAENKAIQALPHAQRLEAFFNCWTRKEAYVKAVGDGLSMPLDRFDVSLAPGEPAQLLRVHTAAQACAWTLLELSPEVSPDPSPATDFRAALVVCGPCRRLSYHDWDGVSQCQTAQEGIP